MKNENLYTTDSIRTVTGLYMNIFEPTLEMICIEDIAHALSRQCRFAGHLPDFYSVASHSINCASMLNGPEAKLAALLHDASEAYLVDIPRPIKPHLTNYKMLEDRLMELIAEKFGFHYPLAPAIHEIDRWMLQWEWECLMLGDADFPFKIKSIEQTQKEFLAIFTSLTKNDTGPSPAII